MRPKVTYANVVATLALFIAIGGASAFAASQLGKNSVGTNQLKKNAVTGAKVKEPIAHRKGRQSQARSLAHSWRAWRVAIYCPVD